MLIFVSEYAAAFFLLAGHLEDCINVLAHQLQDIQLAIAVARVYEGDDGPVLKDFIEKKVLPQAVLEGNRWLATWAFWMLFKRDKAVRALVVRLPACLLLIYLTYEFHKGAPQQLNNAASVS